MTSTPPSTDIAVIKTAPAQADADTDVTLNISVTNFGPNDATTGVTLNDNLVGWTFKSITPGSGFTCTDPGLDNTGLVSCSTPSMLAGATANFTLVVHIPPQTPPGTSFVNTATVSSQFDFTEENNSSTAVTTTPPPPTGDVLILKSGPSSAAPDSDVTYTITVTNGGPSAADNVSFTDTLPNSIPTGHAMTFVSFLQNSGPAFNCGSPGVTTTCTLLSMPAGTTAVFTFTGHIPSDAPGGATYTNSVAVSATNDPNGENNSAATALTVSSTDIAITKSAPPTAIAGGATFDYVITLTNNGPDTATDVSFLDNLPAGIDFVSLVQNTGPAATCNTPANTNGSVACTIPLLGNGQSAQFTVTVQAEATVADGTVTSNTATASSSSFDPNGNNNSSTAMTTISAQADVSIGKSGPATANAGTNITYGISVLNIGPSAANNVVWTDTVPAVTTFVSLTQNTGPTFTCTTGATINCSLASLASGAGATFTLVVSTSPATASGTVLSNTANVSTTTPDNGGGNNTSTVTTTVTTQADVSIVKSGAAAAAAGTNLSYTITVTNAGPSNASSVSWSDVLPPNTSFVSETQDSGPLFTCTTGPTVTCSIATLAPSATASFTLTVLVSPSATNGSSIVNTANVTTTTTDNNAANNTSSVTTLVSANGDLSVIKTGPAQTPSNTQVTYTVTVANAGPSTSANVTLADAVPANLTFASNSQTNGPSFNCTNPPVGGTGTITCTIASFAPGDSATFQFTFNVPPNVAPGTQTTNTATISSTTADPNPANNSSSVITTVASSIPALSTWVLIALGLALAAIALNLSRA
jgi:uncharacterized repeat protein (TIGR01451 family)